MADRFWVGGTGNWSDATNHWATTTGGAPGAGNLPTASDNAIFDTNSHTVGYTVTIDSSATCLDLTFGAPASGTITWAGSAALAISGSMTLLSGMTRTYTGTITFNATVTGKTVTCNGVQLTNVPVTFNGVGGGWTLQDAFYLYAGYLQLLNGSLDTNGVAVNVGSFGSSSGTRTLTLGASTITHVGGGGFVLQGTGITLNAGTSTIVGAGSFYSSTAAVLTFHNVQLTGAAISFYPRDAIFNNLTITGTTLGASSGCTVNGTFTATGTSASARLLINSTTIGTARTITAAAVSLTDVDFTDITGAGAAAPFTGTRLGNCAGNSGITFTAAANKYWVGNTGNWNSTSWALTSGGAAAANNFPLAQDTCVFDANSFSANGQTVTVNGAYRIGSIDFQAGITETGITLANGANAPVVYGSVTLLTGMTITGTTGTYKYSGRNTQIITSSGVSWTQPHNIDSVGGTVQLSDAFTTDTIRSFALTSGTLDLNGQTLSAGSFNTSGSTTRVLTSSVVGGKIATTDTTAATVFTAATSTNLTVTRNSWTIEIGGNTTNIRTFAGGGKTWPALTFTNTTAGGELDFTGSNTFKSISVSNPAQTLKFTAGTTTTIEDTNGFPSGTSGNLVTIGSITAATHTLTKSGGGQISSDFLSISYSTATPGTTWYAGAGSTNGGNNSGWTFSAPPPPPFDFMPWFRRGY